MHNNVLLGIYLICYFLCENRSHKICSDGYMSKKKREKPLLLVFYIEFFVVYMRRNYSHPKYNEKTPTHGCYALLVFKQSHISLTFHCLLHYNFGHYKISAKITNLYARQFCRSFFLSFHFFVAYDPKLPSVWMVVCTSKMLNHSHCVFHTIYMT